jgi:hypothetical protein
MKRILDDLELVISPRKRQVLHTKLTKAFSASRCQAALFKEGLRKAARAQAGKKRRVATNLALGAEGGAVLNRQQVVDALEKQREKKRASDAKKAAAAERKRVKELKAQGLWVEPEARSVAEDVAQDSEIEADGELEEDFDRLGAQWALEAN